VEGRDTTLELRFGEGAIERLPYLATELVALKPAVNVAWSPAAALAARNVTRSIPIIMNSSEIPMVLGLANSLARPGGNVTGFWSGDEGLTGKWFELLKEAVPGDARWDHHNPDDVARFTSCRRYPVCAGMISLSVGRIDQATDYAREALALTQLLGARGAEGHALCLSGDIAATGSDEDVEGCFRQALVLAEPRGMRPLGAHCHLGLGKTHHRVGNPGQAQEHAHDGHFRRRSNRDSYGRV